MREQWFGMCLPVLVLISLEVIWMSHNAEGASTSMVQQRSIRNSGNVMKVEPFDAEYQLPSEQVMSSRKARDTEDITDRHMSGGLPLKNGRLKRSNFTPDQLALRNQPGLPSNGQNAHNQNSHSPIDFDNLINHLTPKPGHDMNDTNHNTQPTGLPYDIQSSYVEPNSTLAQIISLLMPLVNSSLSVPLSVSEMDKTHPSLQAHKPVVESDSSTFLDPIMEIANLLQSQATSTPQTTSPETQASPYNLAGIDTILSVVCGLAKLFVYELNPSIANSMLEAIEIMNNSSETVHPATEQNNSSQPLPSPPSINLESIIEYLNSSRPDVQQSVEGSINLLELVLDYLAHTYPNTVLQELQSTTQPPRRVSRDTRSIDLHDLVSDYYNLPDHAHSLLKRSQPNDNSKNSIIPLLNLLKVFITNFNNTEFRTDTIAEKFGNSERETISSEPSTLAVNLEKTYLPNLSPRGISSQSEYSPSTRNFLDTMKTVIDYFNPFNLDNQTPQNYKTNDSNSVHIVLDNLKPSNLQNNKQASSPGREQPVILIQSSSRHSPSKRNFLDTMKTVIDYFNPFNLDTQTPQNSNMNDSNSVHLILDNLKPSNLQNNERASSPGREEPVILIQSSSRHSPSTRNFLDTMKTVIDYFNPFNLDAQTPQNYKMNDSNSVHLILDNLKPSNLQNNKQASSPGREQPVILIQSSSRHSPSTRNFLDTMKTVVDYLNPFNLDTQTPQNNNMNDSNTVHIVLDNLKPSNPQNNEQAPLPGHEHPVIVIQSPTDQQKPNNDKTPSILNLNVPKPIHIYPDDSRPLKPAANNQKPSQPDNNLTKPVSLADILNAIKLPNGKPKPGKLGIREFNDFESQTGSPLTNALRAIRMLIFFGSLGPAAGSSQLGINSQKTPQQENSNTNYFGPFGADILDSMWDKLQPPEQDQVHVNSNFRPINPTDPAFPDFSKPLASNFRPSYYLPRPYRMRRQTKKINCPDIPSDYYQVEGIFRAYKLHTSNLNWNDALLECQSEHGELALPEDQSQYDSMIIYARNMINDKNFNFHAGFNRPVSGEMWRTVRGDPLPFQIWANNHDTHNDGTDQQCGGIIVSEHHSNGLTSEQCMVPLPYMCQILIPAQCV